MSKQPLYPNNIDTSVAPFSPGIAMGDWVFVSGQGPINPNTMTFELGTIEDETRLTLDNVKSVLEAADCTLDDVVRVNVHLRDINDFERFNNIYATYFNPPYPARATVQSGLGSGISVEIEAIAMRGAGR